MRRARGQAITEVALGLLLIVPVLLGAIFLAEVSIFRLEATEAATEPLWDATAYQHNSYTGVFDRTPGAVGAATNLANGRMRARTMVFTLANPARTRCTAGTGFGLSIGAAPVYADNGGVSCTSQLAVVPNGLTRYFVDQPGDQGAFFKEPLRRMQRNFDFCQNEACRPFVMAIGDWGLTNVGGEENECELTMSGCSNTGFFDFAQATYEPNRTGSGTRGRQHVRFVEGMVQTPPSTINTVTDFQMSFRGEESSFTQGVPVSEGERDWKTSPGSLGAWAASYGARSGSLFLGGGGVP